MRGRFAEWGWPAACAAVLALPVVLVAMPPMVDFPGHEAVVGALRHGGDPGYFPSHLYVSNWGHPNQLQYVLAWPLSYLLGTTRALEAVVALAVVSVVLGAARLARHVGRPTWVAVLVAPVAIGWNLEWGHIAGLLGLGLLLWMLPDLDAFAKAPSARRAVEVFGRLVLLYFAHEGALAVACFAVAVLSLAHRGSIASLALRAAPCLAVALGAWLQLELQHLTPVNAAVLTAVPASWRLHFAPWTLVGFYDFEKAPLVFYAIVLVTLLNAARAARRGLQLPRRFVVLGLALLLGYFVMPANYLGVFFLFQRFLPVAWCVLAVATAPPAGAPFERAARVVCAGIPALMLAFALPSFLASDAAYRQLDALLPSVDRGSGVFSAELENGLVYTAINTRGFSTREAQGHVVALRGGRALADFTQSPISPALVNPAWAWPQMAARNFVEPAHFVPALVFAHFRYGLLHATIPEVRTAVQTVLRPQAHLVAQSAEWMLFESDVLQTRSIDVPEPADYGEPGDGLDVLLRKEAGAVSRP